MSNEVVKADKATLMVTNLETSFVEALPDFLKAKHFSRSLLTAFRKAPKLLNCEPASIGLSVLTSAQLGLQIGVNGQAYLLPYKKECQLIIGYQGLIELCYRSGKIDSISADVVCENDKFTYKQGIEQTLEHIPNLKGDRGAPYAVYAIARIKDSKIPVFVVLNKDEVNKIKKSSPSAGTSFSPWNGEFVSEMWKKTAIRRLVKLLPKSVEIDHAVQFENDQEERVREVSATVVSGTANKTASQISKKIEADQKTDKIDYERLFTNKLSKDCDSEMNSMVAVFEVLTGLTTMKNYKEFEKLYNEISVGEIRFQEYIDALGICGKEVKI